MKKILYLLAVAVLLAACTSKKDIRTYSKGKFYVINSKTDSNNKTVFDTVSVEDANKDLVVLVENDTAWFLSNLFISYKTNDLTKYELHFVNNNPKYEDVVLIADQVSKDEYYTALKFGKFFNFNDIKEIYFRRFDANIINTNTNDVSFEVLDYYLDLDQFKK